MKIKGFQKTTLLDFPGKVAATVFTGGCNFRCPFCHNASLVLNPNEVDDIDEEYVLSYLKKRKGILDGVCITGGEPLLQKDIVSFVEKIKEIGLLIKIDTNGSYFNALKDIINSGCVDYIAMDIKNSFEKYAATIGLPEIPENVIKSIAAIMSSGVDYEFRTTVVKEFHTIEDIESISREIKGAKRYFLQKFTDSGELIADGYSAHSDEDMKNMLDIAVKYVPNAQLRGV